MARPSWPTVGTLIETWPSMTQDVIDDLQTEADNFDTHAADTANPHLVTKAQVGLGDVDNTSDATKNSATATLTNKTLTTPTIASFANATHNHSNAAGGGQITDAALSAAIGISKGGTGQTTAADAINALLPSQSGKAGKVLGTDGSNPAWGVMPGEPVPPWKAGRFYSIKSVMNLDHGGACGMIANEIYATPIFVPRTSGPISEVQFTVNTGVGGSTARLMYHECGSDGHPADLAIDFGTLATDSAGDKKISGLWTLPTGWGFLTVIPSAAITAGAFNIQYPALLGGIQDGSPHRDNGSMTAPDPFGTTSISYIGGQYIRLQVTAA